MFKCIEGFGVELEGYWHDPPSLKGDTSIEIFEEDVLETLGEDFLGSVGELASPPMNTIKSFHRWLCAAGGPPDVVNDSCGMHVHVALADRLSCLNAEFMQDVVKYHREMTSRYLGPLTFRKLLRRIGEHGCWGHQGNTYCHPRYNGAWASGEVGNAFLAAKDYELLWEGNSIFTEANWPENVSPIELAGDNRYCAVNFLALGAHDTIEWRGWPSFSSTRQIKRAVAITLRAFALAHTNVKLQKRWDHSKKAVSMESMNSPGVKVIMNNRIAFTTYSNREERTPIWRAL